MIDIIKLTNNKFFDFNESLSAFNYITENKIPYLVRDIEYEGGYCVINTRHYTLGELVDELKTNSVFSKEFNSLIENDTKIILVNLHETELDKDIDNLYKNLLDSKNIIIANNDTNFIKNKFNHHKTHMIEKSYGQGYIELDIEFVKNKVGKKFLCLNNIKKEHRTALLSILKYENILEDVNYSLIGNTYYPIQTRVCDIEKYKKEINYFKNKNFNTDYDKDVNTFNINKKDFENSYINIVTESFFLENKVHISEKTLKPFWFYQFPLILASPNHISLCEKYYGFDFFRDIIDHSYDLIKDDKERLIKFVEEIKRLNKLDIKKLYQGNENRFLKNRMLCESFCTNEDDYIFFKKIFI